MDKVPATPKAEFTGDDFLDSVRVNTVYNTCARREGYPNGVLVEAWILKHTFSKRILEKYREDIVKMVLALNPGFRVDVKGGGSVSVATLRGDGTVWTDQITDVEKLVALGVATGLVSFCAPRDRWHLLPGGLPFIRVEITRFGVTVN